MTSVLLISTLQYNCTIVNKNRDYVPGIYHELFASVRALSSLWLLINNVDKKAETFRELTVMIMFDLRFGKMKGLLNRL